MSLPACPLARSPARPSSFSSSSASVNKRTFSNVASSDAEASRWIVVCQIRSRIAGFLFNDISGTVTFVSALRFAVRLTIRRASAKIGATRSKFARRVASRHGAAPRGAVLAPFRAYFQPAASRPTEDSIFDVSRARESIFHPGRSFASREVARRAARRSGPRKVRRPVNCARAAAPWK